MSGEEAVQSPGSDPDTLDLSGAELEKLSRATPELILNTTTLVLDNNKLQRLDNIHTYQCLEKVRDAAIIKAMCLIAMDLRAVSVSSPGDIWPLTLALRL